VLHLPGQVVLLMLTEICPKSIAVHNATEVARLVVRPVAWLSIVLYPVGRVVTALSTSLLKLLGLKSSGYGLTFFCLNVLQWFLSNLKAVAILT
jgi:Mg2+/Co2+ transporter CorB